MGLVPKRARMTRACNSRSSSLRCYLDLDRWSSDFFALGEQVSEGQFPCLVDRFLLRGAGRRLAVHAIDFWPPRLRGLDAVCEVLRCFQQAAADVDDLVVAAGEVLAVPLGDRTPLVLHHGDVLQREGLDAGV